jgi:serine/threonine protein kinase
VTDAVREPESGDHIGRYQLVSAIGAGGMGRVWVALDTAAPSLRLVALKTALRDSGNNSEFWAVLSDEATLASRIQHPNVCATYEFGDSAGTHYLVMEWSDGASLRDLLDAVPDHRLEPALAAHIIAAVASGLHAAHELTGDDGHALSVVHRDVSPQNVLISSRGHVRLADFGVAKARGQAHRPTETGEVKGKLSYMSPEQVASKNVDRRADVFALGCILYEATLGVRPFHGNDALATMYKILEEELVRPRALDPEFPELLERALIKSLAKSANDRYATAEEFRADLLEFVLSTRRYVADKQTAELLDRTLGPVLRERNRAIFQLGERLRKGETDPEKLRSPPPPPQQESVTPDGVERTIINQRGPVEASRGLRLLVGAALVVGCAALIVAARGARAPAAASVQPAPVIETAQQAVAVSAPVTAQASALPPSTGGTDSAREQLDVNTKAAPATAHPSRAVPSAVHPTQPTTPAHAQGVSIKTPTHSPRPIDHSNPFVNP